jgi:hypothetical protein
LLKLDPDRDIAVVTAFDDPVATTNRAVIAVVTPDGTVIWCSVVSVDPS